MAGVNVGTAYLTVVPSAKGFTRNLQSQVGGGMASAGKDAGDKAAKGFGSSFGAGIKKAIAPVAATLAAVGVGKFFKDAIDGASDLNEAATKTEAIFGAAGKAMVDQFAAKGAKALGQSRIDVLNAAGTFGTFGKAAGLSGKDLAGFSTGFASLSTDLASFYNSSPEEAVEAIGAALRGEAEPIRKYGVLLDDAALRQEALKLGLIKTTKDALTPQQKVLAAQSAIYKQTKDAQGDFGRTSGGLANQQRILSASFDDLKARIGEKLLPVATRFVKWLVDKGVPGFESVADKVSKFVEKLEPAAKFLKVVFDVMRGGVTDTSGLSDETALLAIGFGANLRDAVETVSEKLMAFGGWLKDDLWPVLKEAWQTILPGLQEAWRILTADVGGGESSLKQLGAILTDYVIPTIAWLTSKALPVWATHMRHLIELAKLLWAGIKIGIGVVGSVVSFVLKRVAELADTFAGFLRSLSKVPGFGWAKDAADKMSGAAGKARELARQIDNIKTQITVNVDIYARTRQTGRIELPNGQTVNAGQRHSGGPVSRNGIYQVGDNPDGSWNRTTELFVPNQSGTILNQSQIRDALSGGGSGLSQADIMRLAGAMSQVQLSTTVSGGSVERAMGAGMR